MELSKLNWSDKLFNPLLSLLLAGTVTTFITVLLMLKSEIYETSFTTLFITNTQTHLPPTLHYSPTSKFNNRLYDYHRLAIPTNITDGKEEVLFATPSNDDELTIFSEELIQYQIFKEIIAMHTQHKILSKGIAGVSSNITKPYKLSETDKKPLTDFIKEISKNRFSNKPMEKYLMDVTYSKLPKNTNIEFKRIPSSEKTGAEKHLIILTKPY